MSYETILTSLEDGILTITMNRPEKLNAWTYQMGDELQDAVKNANENGDVEAIVLTGAGRGFCAGADIKDVFKEQADSGETGGSATGDPRDWVNLIRNSKPCVAAINGAAIGVGLTQVLPMDYLVASEDAKLSARFIKMGVVPELASSKFLVARMGFGNASELMLSGKTVSGTEAESIRLVDKAVPAADLLNTARNIAKSMGENPQAALRMVKQLITENMSEPNLLDVQKREGAALAVCYKSAEHNEAINAFLEKRDPDFHSARKQ
ncbi:MAG: 2-(1,2-epoxy-1,2-dihydrophenyl)acetyl-CoA isomerase [Candidatus Azotimanducaceae bacterium]|jgi:2-(1,2-epoxy-1,2-dihydrophenyl)acetyl-CoA isomerase